MAAVMNAPLYTVEILRLAASLPEPVPLLRVDGCAEARSPTCGSVVRTEVTLAFDGRVQALSQQVSACAFGQASAALVQKHAIGSDRQAVEGALGALIGWLGDGDELPRWGVTALAPARSRKPRHAAILLPFRALLAAMEERK
jgi:NifU-like protein involved in Fe-S cluster formation